MFASKIFSILLILLICTSCKEINPVQENDYFKAKVLWEDIDCNDIYDIEILDTMNLPTFLNDSLYGNFPIYRALNLPESLKIRDLLIKIKFRKPSDLEEKMVCTRMGSSFRFIFILSAKMDE